MLDINVLTLPVGQMRTNCCIVSSKESTDCMIIDPGDDADYIERIISDNKFNPVMILATHGHFDHIMAATELKLAYDIPFVIQERDEFLVKNMQPSAKHFLGIDVDPPPEIDEYLKDGDKLTVGNIELEVVETPGHTPGSICLYLPREKLILTGDTLFADGGVGRTDFSYSSSQDLGNSLKKIFKLPAKTTIYPGHGRESTLGEENIHHNL